MAKLIPIFLTTAAAIAVAGHFPNPCLPLDTGCRIEQAIHLHTHQDGPTLPPIDSKQTVIRAATGKATTMGTAAATMASAKTG